MKGSIEQSLFPNTQAIAGIDEVGRGCLAGPVVAACVILNYQKLFELPQKQKDLIRDSKTLSGKQRIRALELVKSVSIEIGIGAQSSSKIDDIGIVPATFSAMTAALDELVVQPQFVLVDGNMKIPGIVMDQMAVVKGDSLCFCIAAASIVAKVHRDQLMTLAASQFSPYGFDKNVGYGTKAHLSALAAVGPCTIHRRTFEPVRSMLFHR